MPAHVHKQIAEIAKAMAAELYEVVMGDNLIRTEWKRQNPGQPERVLLSRFVARNWAKCIPGARATLTLMLRGPLDEKTKERIMQVLLQDNTLLRGRGRVGEGMDIVGQEPVNGRSN